MARTILKAKVFKVNRAAPSASSLDASAYCRDLHTWAALLDGDGKRPAARRATGGLLPTLHRALGVLESFPEDHSPARGQLWLLGGEIIRDLNYDPSLRKLPAPQLLRNGVGVDGGPIIYDGSEDAQYSLDSTCRKLHRFLSQPQR
jgi:hypothetical protein